MQYVCTLLAMAVVASAFEVGHSMDLYTLTPRSIAQAHTEKAFPALPLCEFTLLLAAACPLKSN